MKKTNMPTHANPKPEVVSLSGSISDEQAGQRLDQAVAQLFPAYSRSCLTQWIKAGGVQVDSHIETQPRYKVHGGQSIHLQAELRPKNHWEGQRNLPLTIVYEDKALLVVNKPAGLVVHPGNGNPDKTLVNALLHHDPSLTHLPRAGLVHRLDKDTTGLLVVARTLEAYKQLTEQLQAHAIERIYEAVVHGVVIAGGLIDAPLDRHPRHRTRMAVVAKHQAENQDYRPGRAALTQYRVVEKYRYHTHLRLQLQTGRTHQIRVHMAHINHPIVGDPTYGRKRTASTSLSDDLRNCLNTFPRQALHAKQLALIHPVTKVMCCWSAPLPDDMAGLLKALKRG